MIDDIKIKEAAMQHSRWLSSNHEESTASDSFMEGAKWMQEEFLKDLWHPASEVPEIGRVIIMENHYSDGRIEFPSHMRKSTFHNPIDGETQRWFYISDLFPKEGGEQ